jgi:hypothetical protein
MCLKIYLALYYVFYKKFAEIVWLFLRLGLTGTPPHTSILRGNNMSTCEVKVLAQNILDFGHRNLGIETGMSDLFVRFFRYFFG